MKHHLPAAIAALAALSLTACNEAPRQIVQKTEVKPAPALAPVVVKPVEYVKPNPDKVLAERVKRALENEAKVHAAAIDVTASSGGIVTLWGTADSDDERIRAARVAYRVQGVNGVHNRLAIVKGS